MKVVISLLLLLPFVLTGPVQQERHYVPEEEDPDFKRFIYMRREDGEVELVDLRAGAGNATEYRVSTSDVEYDLYTLSNRVLPTRITNNNVGALSGSNFNPNKITMFMVHGWTNSRSSEVNTLMRSSVFNANHDLNLFIVDWSSISRKDYLTAKNAVVAVGQIVGNFINGIQSTYGIDGSKIVLAGFSLGAHIVGSAGATATRKVSNIIGLDPAGPLFTFSNTKERLDPSDGDYVQVIHTNGLNLGFSSSLGDIDYYPNGGYTQSGCSLDLTGLCDHNRSYKYLAEAFTRGASVFQARECSSYSSYQLGLCRSKTLSLMGQYIVTSRQTGDFYLSTRSLSPYGRD